MLTALRWVWFLGLLTAVGVGLVALNNWMSGRQDPHWVGPFVLGVCVAGVALLQWFERKGWISGVYRSGSKEKDLEERRRKLAAEREGIIAAAKRV